MKRVILLISVFLLLICSCSTNSDGDCEVVVNADGPGFLKVVNNLNTKISVFLSEYAFEAIVNRDKCEIYGLNTGSRRIEISMCADNDCDTYTTTRTIYVNIVDGETHTIEIGSSFFDN